MEIPEPQKDELDLGLLGRIRILNNIDSEKDTLNALQKMFDDFSLIEPRHPRLLAFATKKHLGDFVTDHTLAPFHYGYSVDRHFTHSDFGNFYLLKWYGRRRPIKEAYFCSTCADEDLEVLGYSYWRRVHHLPGLNYCVTHNVALSVASQLNPYSTMPHTFRTRNGTETLAMNDFREHIIVRRYGEICVDLITNTAPRDLNLTTILIKEWVCEMGLYSGNRGSQRSTLADVATHLLPSIWLRMNFSSVYSRNGQSYVGMLNQTTKLGGAACSEHYALAEAIISSSETVDCAQFITSLKTDR